ncbi:MAG: metallophosphoesterase [Clostridia bacterium]|nr:metallophosphoesterase [Clostridia bacterium]
MWVYIIGGSLAAALAAIAFVAAEVRRAFFLNTFSRGRRWKGMLLAIAAVIIVSVITAMLLNAANMVIIFIHFSVILLLCKLAGKCIYAFAAKASGGANAEANAETNAEAEITANTEPNTKANTKANTAKPARKIFIAAAVITVAYLAYGYYAAHHVIETRYTLDSHGREPLTIVQIADSHIGATMDGAEFSAYMAEISKMKPDLVLFTGDFADDATDPAELEKAAEGLGKIKTKYGVFYSEGNHDRSRMPRGMSNDVSKAVTEAFEKSGVTVLADEAVNIGKDYVLLGRLDKYNESRAPIEELMEAVKNSGSGDRYSIVMDHQPSDYDAEAAAGCSLVLSGHTHGGQFIPILRAGEILGMNDATYGHEKRGDTDFVITSGIGDWSLLFKTGCVSEYVVIELR